MIKQTYSSSFLFQIIKQTCLYLFVEFMMFGCSVPIKNEVKDELISIDVEAVFGNNQEIKLSEVGFNITYIPLETNKSNLIGKIKMVRLTDSFIFISEESKLLQFTREGKFVRQIGKRGHGPDEYSDLMFFDVNEKADNVIICDDFQGFIYDVNGTFIKKVKLPSSYFLFYSPTRIAFYLANNINKPFSLLITDNDLNPISMFNNHNARPETGLKFSTAPLYFFNDDLYFKENFNDTVFIVHDSTFIPHIIYNEKNLLLDKDFDLHPTGKVSDLIIQVEGVKDKLINESIYESNGFVFTSYNKGIDPRNLVDIRILFDKNIATTRVISNGKLVNDIDCGFDIWPIGIFQDSIAFNYFYAFELKAHVASESFKNSTPKYPEKKLQLEQLANGLNENDNPVLMLVKMKE